MYNLLGSSNLSTWDSNICLEKIGPLNGSSSAASLNRMDESRTSKMTGSQVKFLQERERGAGIGYRMVPFCTLKSGQRHRWKSLMEGEYSAILKCISNCCQCTAKIPSICVRMVFS